MVRNGIKTVVEKPAITKRHQLDTVRNLLATGNLYLAYHTKFNPVYTSIQRQIADLNLVSVQVEYAENVHDYHNQGSWVFDSAISGGGCVIDSGVNIFSVINSVIGNIDVTNSTLRNDLLPVEHGAHIIGSSDSGVQIEITMDWLSNSEKRIFRFRGTQGEISIDLASRGISIGGEVISTPIPELVDERAEYTALVGDFESYFQRGEIDNRGLLPIEAVFRTYEVSNISKRSHEHAK